LLPRVYEDLRRLAAQRMSREAAGQTLQLLRYTGAGVTLKGVAARETHLSAIFLPSRLLGLISLPWATPFVLWT
jgi:hypothetical protein